MKKPIKVTLIIVSILVAGGLVLFIFANEFEKKIKILDCEGIYYVKVFEKPRPGYIDFSESNAEKEVAKCLCEKYIKNKDTVYKKEILKIYKMKGWRWEKYEPPKIDIDTICKYRNDIFIKQYDL